MNILEAILSAQNGGSVRQMADRVGVDQGQAQSAIEALLPMLAGAVSRNARQPGGLEGLLGALSDGHHQRYLDDPSTLQDEGTVQDGNAILGHLFGDKQVSREVAARAAAQSGVGADVLMKMLPMLAAMLMGGLSKGASQGGMFGSPSAGQDVFGGGLSGGGRGGAPGGGLGEVLGGLLGGGQGPGLGQAHQPPGGGLLEMLTPMLDRNRDGSAMDDILGMAAQFLQRR